MMHREQFEEYLALHGACIEEWPEELRASAQQLVQSSKEAAISLAEALEVEAALDHFEIPKPSAGFESRILEKARRTPQSGLLPVLFFFRQPEIRRVAAGLALCLFLGIFSSGDYASSAKDESITSLGDLLFPDAYSQEVTR